MSVMDFSLKESKVVIKLVDDSHFDHLDYTDNKHSLTVELYTF